MSRRVSIALDEGLAGGRQRGRAVSSSTEFRRVSCPDMTTPGPAAGRPWPTRHRAAALCALCAAANSLPAHAYRPFDSTDASVADERELEFELGPLGRIREGPAKLQIVSALVVNYGLAGEREVVLEGKVVRTQDDAQAASSRTSLADAALSLKQVHRRGSLQGESGMSVASECSILLPTIHGEPGIGASAALIGSQRWPAATVHLNGALAFNRSHRWSRFFGAIVEGPNEWTVRPVAEVFAEKQTGTGATRSRLLGVIWRAKEDLSFDLGFRTASGPEVRVHEVRAGLTWALPMAK